VLHGPVAFCHEAPKGGYIGSYWPKRRRAPFLLGTMGRPLDGHLRAVHPLLLQTTHLRVKKLRRRSSVLTVRGRQCIPEYNRTWGGLEVARAAVDGRSAVVGY
jgi:hypothetical protein